MIFAAFALVLCLQTIYCCDQSTILSNYGVCLAEKLRDDFKILTEEHKHHFRVLLQRCFSNSEATKCALGNIHADFFGVSSPVSNCPLCQQLLMTMKAYISNGNENQRLCFVRKVQRAVVDELSSCTALKISELPLLFEAEGVNLQLFLDLLNLHLLANHNLLGCNGSKKVYTNHCMSRPRRGYLRRNCLVHETCLAASPAQCSIQVSAVRTKICTCADKIRTHFKSQIDKLNGQIDKMTSASQCITMINEAFMSTNGQNWLTIFDSAHRCYGQELILPSQMIELPCESMFDPRYPEGKSSMAEDLKAAFGVAMNILDSWFDIYTRFCRCA